MSKSETNPKFKFSKRYSILDLLIRICFEIRLPAEQAFWQAGISPLGFYF